MFTVLGSERSGGEAGIFLDSSEHGGLLGEGDGAVAADSSDSHLRLDRGSVHTHLARCLPG